MRIAILADIHEHVRELRRAIDALYEPASTLNTGNVQNERTVAHLDRI